MKLSHAVNATPNRHVGSICFQGIVYADSVRRLKNVIELIEAEEQLAARRSDRRLFISVKKSSISFMR